MTYTIIDDNSGEATYRGLSVFDAADEIMTSDSRQWVIRKDEDGLGYTAWTCQQVANRPWTRTIFYSGETDLAAAEIEICQKIVDAPRMIGHCEAMTDEAYDRMIKRSDSR